MESNQEHRLEQAVLETLHDLIATGPDSKRFDTYDPTSNLLSLADFTAFILVPFAATALILQDIPGLDTLPNAISERNNSKEYGLLIHPEDDDESEVQEIHRQNLLAIRRVTVDEAGLWTEPKPKPKPVKSEKSNDLFPPGGAGTGPPRLFRKVNGTVAPSPPPRLKVIICTQSLTVH